MDIEAVTTQLTNTIADSEVIVEQYEYGESTPAVELYQAGILQVDETETEVYELRVFSSEQEVAVLVVMVFPSVQWAYVSEVEVAPAYRTEGLEEELYTAICTGLWVSSITRIYSNPSTVTMRESIESHGGESVMELDGWYVQYTPEE